ncbi:RICIN domain-containing protein, partial [Lachnoclostridium phytofermentans]
MKKKISKILGLLLAIMLVVQTATTFVLAKEITSNATVYIKNASTGSYLYASGSSVKAGSFQEKNPYYIWSITKKTDGSFWIQNMGTNSYLCLEHASGKALLESTIYEVWMSSKWYIEGNNDSSTIDNMWKSTRNSGTGGYLYTNSGSADVFYGTTAQRWVFEDYSSSAHIPEDGVSGKLTNKVAADTIVVPGANSDISSIGATMPYVRYDSEYAVLGGGARLATSTDWALTNVASQASNQSYVVLPSGGSYAEWRLNSSGNGVVMRFTLPDTADGMG